jgi:hypothetical protein
LKNLRFLKTVRKSVRKSRNLLKISVYCGERGVQGELSRWDGLPAERKDDYIHWARKAAHDASTAYEPKKKRKTRGNHRRSLYNKLTIKTDRT